MSIDKILKEPENQKTAQRLENWIHDINSKILRGDFMIGILPVEEVQKIPEAYIKLYKCGDYKALDDLASWYTNPAVGNPDFDKVEETYNTMITAKIPHAMLNLARFRWYYRRDELTQKEKKDTLQLLEYDVNARNADALLLKGYMIAEGYEGKPDINKALDLFISAVERGSTDAMFELYIYYSSGKGTDKDPEKAYNYNKMAAEKNHSRALYNMGSFYATGTYVNLDMDEAVKWYKKASEQYNAKASFTLGVMYASGNEIAKDTKQAAEYFNAAEMDGFNIEEVDKMRNIFGIDQ